MANLNLTPNAGNLNLSLTNPRLTPLAAALLAVGVGVSVLAAVRIPFGGTLASTGQLASIKTQGIVTAPTGALVLGGQTVARGSSLTPGTGAIITAGVEPSAVQGLATLITPPPGNLTLGERAPFTPDTGALVLSGSPPGRASLAPPAGTLTLTAIPPIIAAGSGSIVLTPTAGAAFFGDKVGVTVSLGALSVVGGQPALLINAIRIPSAGGALVLSGISPRILGTILTPATGSLIGSGVSIAISRSLIASTGALSLAGQFAAMVGFVQIVPDTGGLNLDGAEPSLTVSLNLALSPSRGALTITGLQPSRDSGLSPLPGALVITGTTSRISGQSAAPNSSALALEGQLPVLLRDVYITPLKASLVATGVPSNINGLPPRGGVRYRPRPSRPRVFVVPDREERLV